MGIKNNSRWTKPILGLVVLALLLLPLGWKVSAGFALLGLSAFLGFRRKAWPAAAAYLGFTALYPGQALILGAFAFVAVGISVPVLIQVPYIRDVFRRLRGGDLSVVKEVEERFGKAKAYEAPYIYGSISMANNPGRSGVDY